MSMLRTGLTLAYSALMLALTVWITVSHTRPNFSRERARAPSQNAASSYRDTAWKELLPANWDPAQELRAQQRGMQFIQDGSPVAIERLRKMREQWALAPADSRWAGQALRLHGYVVPLEMHRHGVTEFLLVPYYGACIHAPPPPANQIVRVVLPAASPKLRAMDAVHVSGVLRLESGDSEFGSSSYAMQAESIEPYTP